MEEAKIDRALKVIIGDEMHKYKNVYTFKDLIRQVRTNLNRDLPDYRFHYQFDQSYRNVTNDYELNEVFEYFHPKVPKLELIQSRMIKNETDLTSQEFSIEGKH